jgi:8-oxo-dGTP diphosphatase
MRTAYCIAFRGDRFLMVYNPRREGWEMPGGKVEEGESFIEAARREFREESGMDVIIVGGRETDDGMVFCGQVTGAAGRGEMEADLFDQLPERLAFPRCEYAPLIAWAREVLQGGSQVN